MISKIKGVRLMDLQNHFSIRLYDKTVANLNYLLAQWNAKPFLIKRMPDNRSALINMLLTDYSNYLIEEQRQDKKKSYDQIAAELNHSRSERETVEKLHRENEKLHKDNMQLLNRLNELYYLQMIATKVLIETGGLNDLESMFEFGSTEYKIHQALQQLVDEDNKRLFVKTKNQKG
ncbi:hypothetical protein ACLOC9_07830 [Limosilactobacillus mucosae]